MKISLADLAGLRKTSIIIAKTLGTGLEFLWDLSLLDFLYFLQDYNDVINEENERIKKQAKERRKKK